MIYSRARSVYSIVCGVANISLSGMNAWTLCITNGKGALHLAGVYLSAYLNGAIGLLVFAFLAETI